MTIESFFHDASSVFTVVSLLTFLGIVWRAYSAGRRADFEEAANLPFADDDELDHVTTAQRTGQHHG
jgi:cytochrome c oxidase cbb3-type subunit 4